jgi:hypothetical protein
MQAVMTRVSCLARRGNATLFRVGSSSGPDFRTHEMNLSHDRVLSWGKRWAAHKRVTEEDDLKGRLLVQWASVHVETTLMSKNFRGGAREKAREKSPGLWAFSSLNSHWVSAGEG